MMFPNIYSLLFIKDLIFTNTTLSDSPITDDGGISAQWVLVVIMTILGALITIIISNYNNQIKEIKNQLQIVINNTNNINLKVQLNEQKIDNIENKIESVEKDNNYLRIDRDNKIQELFNEAINKIRSMQQKS